MFFKKLLCLLLIGLSCSCAAKHKLELPADAVYTNQIANNFHLKYLNGKSASLAEQRGKYVLLHFWASWCSACLYELETLNNLKKRLGEDKFEILAVAIDDKWSAVKKVADKGKFVFPLMVDEGGSVRDSYRVGMIPESFLISPEGSLVKFASPENNSLVLKTSGPQQWDKESVVQYFSRIVK